MKRVLIVSPHFPPVNAPDMQRARHMLPYLRGLGWEPVVLAVAPESVEGAVLDPLLLETYPTDIRVIRVRGISPQLTRRFGIGSLWWRCGRALRRAGDTLLTQERFDLIFFTTTQFGAFTLGPRWRRRFNVPYVLDYQDPWLNPYYRDTGTRPPGGWLKFHISQACAKLGQGKILRDAGAVIAVSPAYGPMLHRQHSSFRAESVEPIPFAVSPTDFTLAARHQPNRSLVPFSNGCVHHVYVGRCGPDMSIALTVLFRAVKEFHRLQPQEARRHYFHFIGTDYAPPPLAREWVMPTARTAGVEDYVVEHNYRVPYFDALYYLTNANALLVIGSNDVAYSPSKVYPSLMARRPLLFITHQDSPMYPVVRAEGINSCYTFNHDGASLELISRVADEWFIKAGWAKTPPTTGRLLEQHGAEAMTRRICAIFAAVGSTGCT